MLGDFLKRQLGVRGPWNCSTFPADWCIALGHPDYAADWRGITDPDECEAVAADGLVPLWERGIGSELPVVTEFREGDIGVVRYGGFEKGAIFTGERWALKGEHRFAFVALPASAVLKAWRP